MGQNKSASTDKERSPLKKLKVLSQKTKLSDSDIRAAEELNEALGGMYSHLILAMQTRLEQEKNGKSSNNLGQNNRMKSVDALLADQDKYFENEKIKKTYETLKSIGSGKVPSDEELCDMAESLSNNYNRKFRQYAIQAITEEALGIIDRSCDERRSLTPEEAEKLKRLLEAKKRHERAEHHSNSIDQITGKPQDKKALHQKVRENQGEIISESQRIENLSKESEERADKLFELFGGLSNGLKDQSDKEATNKRLEGMRSVGREMFETEIVKGSDGRFTSFMNQAQTEYVDSSRSKSPDSTPGQGATRNKGRV